MEEISQLNEKEYMALIEQWKINNKSLIDGGKCKKVFVENLPTRGKTKQINWKGCKGCKVYFIYNDIKGYIEIINKINKSNYIDIKYLKKTIKIDTRSFVSCKIGMILGEKTSDFKIEIGQVFKNDNKNLTIIEKNKIEDKNGRKRKYYKYHCNNCGYECGKHWSSQDKKYKDELWMEENNVFLHNCACCTNQIVVQGINDIPTVAPWMIPYFQGGYDEAKLYGKNSGDKIFPICLDCGRINKTLISISSLYHKGNSCSCSDKIPYSEKFMFSLLEQLGIDFQTQLSKNIFNWCKNYRYDFYFKLKGEEYIIETHGNQHYDITENFSQKGGRTLKQEVENDKNKKELALKNGIKEENYIIIDCRKSELKWIKENILNSKISKLFDLSKINWLTCHEFSLNNRIKETCELWNTKMYTTKEIASKMKVHRGTIREWLKKGNIIDWCNYNVGDAKIENNLKTRDRCIMSGKPILCIDNGYLFLNINDCINNSIGVLGVQVTKTIYCAITNRQKTHKGFTFKYISDLTEEEYIKYDVENKLKEIQENAKLN